MSDWNNDCIPTALLKFGYLLVLCYHIAPCLDSIDSLVDTRLDTHANYVQFYHIK